MERLPYASSDYAALRQQMEADPNYPREAWFGRQNIQTRVPRGEWWHRGPSDITDDKWDPWYQAISSNSEDAAMHRQFVSELDNTLKQPFIRPIFGDPMSPMDFMADRLAEDKFLAEDESGEEIQAAVLANARANMAGLPPVENKFGITPKSKVVQDLVGQTITAVSQSGHGGPDAEFDPVTESQYKDWQGDSYMDARYRLTEGGKRNMEATRAANLMKTFQSGDNAPGWATTSGAVLGAAGAAAAATARNFTVRDPNQKDTLDVMWMGGRNMDATPAGRLREAMYWHGQYAPGGDYYKTSMDGAKLPQFSSTTLQGVGTNLSSNENASSWTSLWPRTFLQQPLETTEQERDLLNRAQYNLVRTQPIVADGAKKGDAETMQRNLVDRTSQNEGWLSAQLPRAIEGFNRSFGTQVTPRYMTGLENTASNMPRWMFEDAYTPIATAGKLVMGPVKALATAGTRAAGRSLIKSLQEMATGYGKEIPSETAQDAAINPPPSLGEWAFKAEESNPWMGSEPKMDSNYRLSFGPVSATDPEYEMKYNRVFDQRRKKLDQMQQNADAVLPQ